MLPKSRHNIGFLRPLIKVLEALEVCKVFLFVSGLREGHGKVFPSDPFIKVIFDLDSESMSREEETKNEDLQLSIRGRWLITRPFHPRRIQGGLRHRLFFLGTRSC